jgi:hypothetical protein
MAPISNLTAIRVKDVANQGEGVYYNWDNGSWDSKGAPKCKNSGQLYIAAYWVNTGGQGLMIARIIINGSAIAQNNGTVAAGSGISVEYTGTMPASGNIEVTVMCTP